VTALVAGAAVWTCLGSGAETFAALLRGACGVGPLRHGDPARLNVAAGYHIGDEAEDPGRPLRASGWLSACVRRALDEAGVDPMRQRVVALVGTGLRELSAVEEIALGGPGTPVHRLNFGAAVRTAAPGIGGVVTIANACSASGHALALAQDLVELGEADAVVVGGADAMTQSMLAMIGRVADAPTERVRPFDRDRQGVLLGEGAAAAVVVPESWPGPAAARLVATGLSCDAFHETAPSVEGIGRAMRDAYRRAGRAPAETGVVVAHGTGTALNDPTECAALRELLAGADPLITAVKGALGHMSGTAALIGLDVAIRCLADGVVPPVVGLREVLPEGADLSFVRDRPAPLPARLAQVNAFGFGGVNAVTLVEPR
jgi:3-oxoacyl-[acyl-carrier-protein] synthase II